jgi:hypothetical protein
MAFTLVSMAAACGGTSEADPPRNIGVIGVHQVDGVSSGFASYSTPAKGWKCVPELIGDCEIARPCVEPRPFPSAEFFDAGTVTVQGTVLERTISYFSALPRPIVPGETVEMSASGSADVPAHHGEVLLPPLVTGFEPALDGSVRVDRTEDLRVAWTPEPHGSVSVGIVVSDAESGSGTAVRCSASASSGEILLPASMLRELPPTSSTAGGRIYVEQQNQLVLFRTGWSIYLDVLEPTASTTAEIF